VKKVVSEYKRGLRAARKDLKGAFDWAIGGVAGFLAIEFGGLAVGALVGALCHLFVVAIWAAFTEDEV